MAEPIIRADRPQLLAQFSAASDYASFLDAKAQLGGDHGFEPVWLPDTLFDFQRSLVEWAIRKGRAAIFADCGLGKTPMQLVWAENVARHTGGRVLILTPLAVAAQTAREAEKFGVEAYVSRNGRLPGAITITNYEMLSHFDAGDFVGVVCDESSILKSFDGVTRNAITAVMRKLRYRLLATATAAPNDYTELGTSSEALGYLGHVDMLARFFVNDQSNSASGRHYGEQIKWRLKGHAEEPFWRWVSSWARAARRPSDLGFDDAAFELPGLTEREHIVESRTLAEGMLFALPASGLVELREESRRTIQERCERIAALVATSEPALVWCNLNDEADLLERLIPDAEQVKGAHSHAEKERRLTDFVDGRLRVLISKPKIGAWGLNFQHCAHVALFPTYSYESYYQGIRRCWRFGQSRPVVVDVVATEGQRDVMASLRRKAAQADAMFTRLTAAMNSAIAIDRLAYATVTEEIPQWL
jgi:hypothetical protein